MSTCIFDNNMTIANLVGKTQSPIVPSRQANYVKTKLSSLKPMLSPLNDEIDASQLHKKQQLTAKRIDADLIQSEEFSRILISRQHVEDIRRQVGERNTRQGVHCDVHVKKHI